MEEIEWHVLFKNIIKFHKKSRIAKKDQEIIKKKLKITVNKDRKAKIERRKLKYARYIIKSFR